jgi:hypothetical protein
MSEATSSPAIRHFEFKEEWRKRWSAAAVTSFILAGVVTVLLLAAKIVGATLAYGDEDVDLVAGQLGSVLFFCIAPIGLGIVFGHIGLVHTWGGRRKGWVLAGLGLGAGYLHLLLWLVRVVVATIVAFKDGDILWFMYEFFWWA